MIKGINSNSRHIVVTGGGSAAPYINATNLSAGQLRYNPGMQCMEVYDGNTWQQMPSAYASVDVSEETKQILIWAAEKMRKEKEIESLCEKYPGLAKARDNYELFKKFVDAQEQADNDTGEMQVATSP